MHGQWSKPMTDTRLKKKQMKQFDIPNHFRSPVIGRVKEWRRVNDPRKKDFSPTRMDLGSVELIIPRHMGFCYGVENAIEISYRALRENPGKRIFLLSQMIHNPAVNADLEALGIRFIMDTEGFQFIPWEEITKNDVVITPAFGTTVEIEHMLREKGVELATYNTTCPFVEKVWKRSAEIGSKGFTVIIHGKYRHEETRATFSHSYQNAPSVVVRDRSEAEELARAIRGEMGREAFFERFAGKCSEGFDPTTDLRHMGVVNQTTMLASETQEIADFIREVVTEHHGPGHFADTRDTLCYATNDNQEATLAVLSSEADLALVVGGFNSSNTAQLVTILSARMPVYYIRGEEDFNADAITHFDYENRRECVSKEWIPAHRPLRAVVTSGASCPDAVVEAVMRKFNALAGGERSLEDAVHHLVQQG
jgi:4-hydroxy-3-methylbut-2-enyl diphosphate reductase